MSWRVIEMNAGDPDLWPERYWSVDEGIDAMIAETASREGRTPDAIRSQWFEDTEDSPPMITRYDNDNGSVTLADDRGDWQCHIVGDTP